MDGGITNQSTTKQRQKLKSKKKNQQQTVMFISVFLPLKSEIKHKNELINLWHY